MATSFKAKDGKTIRDGDTVTLVLRKGELEIRQRGTVRAFDHVEPVYKDDPDVGRIVVGKTSDQKWEISTDDPQHPAIGFLPENVLSTDS